MKTVILALLMFCATLTPSLVDAEEPTEIRDSLGRILGPTAPGVNVTLDIKLLLHRYLAGGTSMTNPWASKHPANFRDLFGDSTSQSKFWPWLQESIMQPTSVAGFIEFIYVELVDVQRSLYYMTPAWIRNDGMVMGFNSDRNKPQLTVKPNSKYQLRLHMVSGTDPVATDTFSIASTITEVNWDFRIPGNNLNNIYGFPNSFRPIANYPGVVALTAGDTWYFGVAPTMMRHDPSRNELIDVSDIMVTANLRTRIIGWYVADHIGNDGVVTDDDWIPLWDDDILFTMSGVWYPYFSVRRDDPPVYVVKYTRQGNIIKAQARKINGSPDVYWGLQGGFVSTSTVDTAYTISGWDNSLTTWRKLLATNVGFGNIDTSDVSDLYLNDSWQDISTGFVSTTGIITNAGVPNKLFVMRNGIATDVSAETQFIYEDVPTSIVKTEIPVGASLIRNYPNPFNPSTTIEFVLPVNANVDIVLYNVVGQVVSKLVSGVYTAGIHTLVLDASNYPSGVYFVKYTNNSNTQFHKLTLTK